LQFCLKVLYFQRRSISVLFTKLWGADPQWLFAKSRVASGILVVLLLSTSQDWTTK
jgi:hypothetical protein